MNHLKNDCAERPTINWSWFSLFTHKTVVWATNRVLKTDDLYRKTPILACVEFALFTYSWTIVNRWLLRFFSLNINDLFNVTASILRSNRNNTAKTEETSTLLSIELFERCANKIIFMDFFTRIVLVSELWAFLFEHLFV